MLFSQSTLAYLVLITARTFAQEEPCKINNTIICQTLTGQDCASLTVPEKNCGDLDLSFTYRYCNSKPDGSLVLYEAPQTKAWVTEKTNVISFDISTPLESGECKSWKRTLTVNTCNKSIKSSFQTAGVIGQKFCTGYVYYSTNILRPPPTASPVVTLSSSPSTSPSPTISSTASPTKSLLNAPPTSTVDGGGGTLPVQGTNTDPVIETKSNKNSLIIISALLGVGLLCAAIYAAFLFVNKNRKIDKKIVDVLPMSEGPEEDISQEKTGTILFNPSFNEFNCTSLFATTAVRTPKDVETGVDDKKNLTESESAKSKTMQISTNDESNDDYVIQAMLSPASICGVSLQSINCDEPSQTAPVTTSEYECIVPPGSLGLSVETANEGPTVHSVKHSSVLQGYVNVGDLIVSVDGEDTLAMSAERVTGLLATKSHQLQRRVVFRKQH